MSEGQVPDQTTGGGSESAPTVIESPAVPPPSSLSSLSRIYTGRFLFIYTTLAVVLVAAVTGAIVLALKPGPPKPPPWSGWRPASGNTATMAGEIVSHIEHQYKLSKNGRQLVVVFPSAPEVHQDSKSFDVSTIGVRLNATSENFSQIVPTNGITQQEYCGLGESCAISVGTATQSRERLVRREALEIALYTFKYVPAINGLLAYMPPPPGQAPEDVLFLQRSNLQKELSEPLDKTLPLAMPPLPSDPDTLESSTIDRLTLPVEYAFGYSPLTSKTQALILTPSS